MVIHVLADISQEAGGDNTDRTKRDTGIVDVLVCASVSDLSSGDNQLLGAWYTLDTLELTNLLQKRSTSKRDGLGDDRNAGDVELEDHSTSDVLDGERYKLVVEDVVVDAVSDRSTNDTNGQSQGSDSRNKVIRADNGRDDRSWNDDTTNSETSDDEDTPEDIEIVDCGNGESTAASSHQNGGTNHQLAVLSPEDGQKPKDNAGTGENRKANWDTADTDANGVVTVDIEGLGRPEHENAEEVGSRDESDDQSEQQDAGRLHKSPWEHWKLGELGFPHGESDKEGDTEDEWDQDMCRAPLVLVATPLHTSHEQDHTGNTEETTDKVNLTDHLLLGETARVYSWWREVEDSSHDRSNGSPDTAQKANPAPGTRGLRRNQLTPENGWAERNNGEDEYGDVLAALGSRCEFRCSGKSSELVDTGTNSSKDHTTDEDVHLLGSGANDHS